MKSKCACGHVWCWHCSTGMSNTSSYKFNSIAGSLVAARLLAKLPVLRVKLPARHGQLHGSGCSAHVVSISGSVLRGWAPRPPLTVPGWATRGLLCLIWQGTQSHSSYALQSLPTGLGGLRSSLEPCSGSWEEAHCACRNRLPGSVTHPLLCVQSRWGSPSLPWRNPVSVSVSRPWLALTAVAVATPVPRAVWAGG